MAEASSAKLYSPKLLALCAALADFPLDEHFQCFAEGRSRTCGSTVKIGLNLDSNDGVSLIGLQVSACAVGQSSAAILALGLSERTIAQLVDASAKLEGWLAGNAEMPDWPQIEALEPALPYPGRHEAIVLPWRAAIEALSTPLADR